jgi:hypothetical protein
MESEGYDMGIILYDPNDPRFLPSSPTYARGHLLGNQLGGAGNEPRNLVTIFQNPANHPVMSGFEAQIRGRRNNQLRRHADL